MDNPMKSLVEELLESYANCGGIKHLNGATLPSKMAVATLTQDLLHIIFPGFIAEQQTATEDLPHETALHLRSLERRLKKEIAKSLDMHPVPGRDADSVTLDFLRKLPDVRCVIQTDVEAAYQGDPAAASKEEVVLAYPGVEAVAVFRLAHELHRLRVAFLPRMMTEWAHSRTGIDLHPGAEIGSHFFIDHGTGVVIGGTAKIGNRVRLYQGVGLVARSLAKNVERDDQGAALGGKRHPTVGDDVTIYANSTIVGGDTVIGDRTIIGGNVWLNRSVPRTPSPSSRRSSSAFIRASVTTETGSSDPAPGADMERIYLDANATTRLDPRVRAVMDRLLAGPLGNPSSLHAEGRRARGEIDAARDALAAWLGAKPSEIVFTAGGTESCNLAVRGLALAQAQRGQHLITARTEHHAVMNAFQALERSGEFAVTWLDVDGQGLVDPGQLARAIRSDTDAGVDHERQQRDRRAPAAGRDRRGLRRARRALSHRRDPERGQGDDRPRGVAGLGDEPRRPQAARPARRGCALAEGRRAAGAVDGGRFARKTSVAPERKTRPRSPASARRCGCMARSTRWRPGGSSAGPRRCGSGSSRSAACAATATRSGACPTRSTSASTV